MEIKHAVLSPSGADRWMVCGGSPRMERGLPDNGNEYSAEGTCAHAVAKMCLVEGKPATAYIGRRVHVSAHETYEFREDMAEPVQCYVDFVDSLPGEKHYEVAVPIGHLTGEEGAEGTADVLAITEDQEELICVDLKFGGGVRVSAKENRQGMLYALGALAKLDVLGSFKRVRIFIHQPRVSETPDEWDCTVEELQAFAVKVEERALIATAILNVEEFDPATLVPGEVQCQFCKAKATCPGLRAYVEKAVGVDLEVLAVAPQSTVASLVPTKDVELGEALKAAALVEDWIKAVRAECERRLLAGEPVPGYKLVEGRMGNRAWSDEKAVEDLMRKTFRMPIEEAYDLKLISPTKAEAKLKEHPKRWVKLQPLITRSPGKPSVAPEDDKRAAVSNKAAAADFDEGADLV